jgi:hypothetical protein
MTDKHLTCTCGQVELRVSGPPILAAACYCDDCQAGARQLSDLGAGPSVVGADGGTPYVLQRKDRVGWLAGEHLLQRHKLRPGTATNRITTACCNTPMLVDFDRGPHWVAIYQSRFDPAPPMEMLVNTRFAPANAVLPNGVSAYRTFPPRFVGKLVASRLAMLFGR